MIGFVHSLLSVMIQLVVVILVLWALFLCLSVPFLGIFALLGIDTATCVSAPCG